MADKYSVPIEEQETYINFMRDEPFATICTSDSTQITRLNKLCAANPDVYSLVGEDGAYKRYKCMDKSLVSLRSKKIKREMTEEQKREAGERMRKYHANKNA